MTAVATVLLLAALPILLWPLLRPGREAGLEPEPGGDPAAADILPHRLEEVALDLETGRIDAAEAGRREEEIRREAGGPSA